MNHPVDLVDFKALLKGLAALPVFADTPLSVRRGIKLDIGRSRRPRHIAGRASIRQRRLRIVVGPWVHASRVLEVFLHELVHLALPERTSHSARFRLTLVRAAREAWGIVVDPRMAKGDQRLVAYAVDEAITAQLHTLVEIGRVDIPAPVARPPRAVVLAQLVNERAEHAMRMHQRALRRLARVRASEKRWRTKVRYYERQAAKPARKDTK